MIDSSVSLDGSTAHPSGGALGHALISQPAIGHLPATLPGLVAGVLFPGRRSLSTVAIIHRHIEKKTPCPKAHALEQW